MVRKTLLAYFDRLNKKFRERGIEFYVQDNHYWIEIRINKSKADTWRSTLIEAGKWDPDATDS